MIGPILDGHLYGTCRLGQGAATCAFLVMSPEEGFCCAKGDVGLEAAIRNRLFLEQMKAQGDNCEGWEEVRHRR